MRRENWNECEDQRRTSKWNVAPKRAGLKKCGKSCKLRCTNTQKRDKRDESFTPDEEELIIRLHQAIGSRWSMIAQQIPGRTENEVKNYWNTKLKKKLTDMGIDPVTHRPFSQLLAEYGNMSSLNRESKNAFVFRPEQGLSAPRGNFPSQDGSSSTDLLAQLQAITLVTEASKISTNKIDLTQNDCSSSTSSSGFSWRDFLVEDPFLPGDEARSDSKQNEKQIFEAVKEKGCDFSINVASSSSDFSFVETMVDRQNEMLSDFPELLKDSFFY